VWVTDDAIAAWHAPATGKRGGQAVYSDVAIETGLALRLVLRLGLRQLEGTLGSMRLSSMSPSASRIIQRLVGVAVD
jgi:hypothetical protein